MEGLVGSHWVVVVARPDSRLEDAGVVWCEDGWVRVFWKARWMVEGREDGQGFWCSRAANKIEMDWDFSNEDCADGDKMLKKKIQNTKAIAVSSQEMALTVERRSAGVCGGKRRREKEELQYL